MSLDKTSRDALYEKLERHALACAVDDPKCAADIRALIADNREQTARATEIEHRLSLRERLLNIIEAGARIDELTGLYNLRGLNRQAQTIFEKYKEEGKDLSVLYIDLNYFKLINDTYGHDAGDAVLKQFAASHRISDLFFRLGGDEFLLMLPETDLEGAIAAAERLRMLVESMKTEHKGKDISLTISVGVAAMDQSDENFNALKNRADKACLKANEDGRNRTMVSFPNGEMEDKTAPGSLRPQIIERYGRPGKLSRLLSSLSKIFK